MHCRTQEVNKYMKSAEKRGLVKIYKQGGTAAGGVQGGVRGGVFTTWIKLEAEEEMGLKREEDVEEQGESEEED